jgi:translation initiation factor RLI1
MATVTAFETHRHFLGVVRLDLELPDCIAGILEELHLCEGCAQCVGGGPDRRIGHLSLPTQLTNRPPTRRHVSGFSRR